MNENAESQTDKADLPKKSASFADEPQVWLCLLMWTFPIWWTLLYCLILAGVNLLTTKFGSPLYLVFPGAMLNFPFGLVLLAALVLSIFITKPFKESGLCTFVIWWFIYVCSGMTGGGMAASFELAAGRQMRSFSHAAQPAPVGLPSNKPGK